MGARPFRDSIAWLVLALGVAGSACSNSPSGGVASGESTQPYRDHLSVTAWPRGEADVQALWRHAEHVLSPHDPMLAPHELVIKTETMVRLRSLGIPLTVEPIDVQSMIDETRSSLQLAHAAGKLGIFGPFFDQVRQLDALEKYLDELALASEGRAQVITIGNSVENRPIKAIRVSSSPEGTDRASVIITGTQHAREWASPMVTIGLADAIVRQYGTDAQVKKIVDTLEIFIIPVVNPDGYFASHNGKRLQRKNMNPVCNVDLNRNWGEWWGMGTPRNGCNEETFPGAGAFSEPETQAVRRLAESRKNLRFYMDYHSAANQVMYPLCFERSRSPDQDEDKAWSEMYAKAFAGVNGANIPSQSCFGIGGGEGGCSTDWFRKRLPNGLEVELRSGGSLGGFGLTNDLVLPFVEENWMGWVGVLAKVAEKNAAPGSRPVDAGTDASTDGNNRPPPDAAAPDMDMDMDLGRAPDATAGQPPPPDATAPAPEVPAPTPNSGDGGRPGVGPTDPASGCGCHVNAQEGSGANSTSTWAPLVLLAALARIRRRVSRRPAGSGRIECTRTRRTA